MDRLVEARNLGALVAASTPPECRSRLRRRQARWGIGDVESGMEEALKVNKKQAPRDAHGRPPLGSRLGG